MLSQRVPSPEAGLECAQVLVLSDDDVVRDLLAVVLKQQRMTIRIAGHADEALAALREQRIELVFVDVRPTAIESRRFLDQAPANGRARWIFIADAEEAGDLLGRKPAAWLQPPFEAEAIREALQQAGWVTVGVAHGE